MKFIGAHVDGVPDLSFAPAEAAALGAKAFALNLVDPSKFRSPALDPAVAEAFRANCARLGFTAAHILPHAGFVINLASPEPQKLKLSRMALADEMMRAEALGLTMLNFHPGAHLKKMSDDDAVKRVSESLNKVLADTNIVTAVIENTAGQGSNIGYSFAQLGAIIEGIDDKSRVGVCIDSAHAFAAGYDLATEHGYRACWEEFEASVGFCYLRGMHLNDSQRPLGSRIDRHESIGLGTIGDNFFRRLMQDPRFDNIPMILETPNPAIWRSEVAQLYEWANESN